MPIFADVLKVTTVAPVRFALVPCRLLLQQSSLAAAVCFAVVRACTIISNAVRLLATDRVATGERCVQPAEAHGRHHPRRVPRQDFRGRKPG